MGKCSCQTCMREFCRNIWVRIGYTILLAAILVVGLLFFTDSLSALRSFRLKDIEEGTGLYTVTNTEQQKMKGTVIDITYGSGVVTIFELDDGRKCISYNKDEDYAYDGTFQSIRTFQPEHLEHTQFNEQNITCYPYFNEEQFKEIENQNNNYEIVYYTMIVFIIIIIIILLLILICCDGCCKCACCSIFHMCCE